MKTMTEVMPVLKAIRREKNISIQEVVDYIKQEVRIDVAAKTVYGWENLSSKPDVMCFMALCSLYELKNVQELFGSNTDSLYKKPTLKDELYNSYVAAPNEVKKAVHILLDIEEN